MAVRDRHSSKAPAAKFDPIGGDIEEVENLIRFHKRKLAADERDAARYDPEFIDKGILNSIAAHNRELKKLNAKLARLKKRKDNPMAKKKAKRKATPAQLRALAKGRATAARNRKTKAPKRKRAARRRNPAYGNYSTARAVARGSRAVNPVRPLMYFVMRGARYFTGYSFSKERKLAVHYTSVGGAKAAAQKLADKTGSAIRIVDARK